MIGNYSFKKFHMRTFIFLLTLFLPAGASAEECSVSIPSVGKSSEAFLIERGSSVTFLQFQDAGTKEVRLKGEVLLWHIPAKDQSPWILAAYAKGRGYKQGWLSEQEAGRLKHLTLSCP